MTNRILLSVATVIGATSLAIGAAIAPGGDIPAKVVSKPEKPAQQEQPLTPPVDALEEPCLAVDQIMYQSLGPALDTLEDTPEARQNTADVLREQAPNFEQIAQSISGDPASVVFEDFAQASVNLADALESEEDSNSVQVRFDEFNAAGTQMSELCFAVYENLNPSQ